MLIYTGWYICLLVMIIFKGIKLIKGRKMDSWAAQSCSPKPAAVATPSSVFMPRGPWGWPVWPGAGWWLELISSATDSLVTSATSLCLSSHYMGIWGHPSLSLGSPVLITLPPPTAAPFCWQRLQEVSEGFIPLPLVFRRFQCLTAYSRQT